MDKIIKHHLVKLSLVFLLLNSSVTLARSAGATEADNWAKLATKGNVVAMYNLANYYSQDDTEKSAELLNDAAQSGLVQAYLDMNQNALSSAAGKNLSFESGPAVWLKHQSAEKYTIQLASSRHKKSIEKIYSEHDLKGNGSYYHYQSSGRDRYAVVYGAYDTVAEAKFAFTKLPPDLRKRAPWVRRIGTLQKIIE